MSYTKGPWNFDKWGKIMNPHGEQICVDGVSIPCGYRPDDDPAKANSRLVCAAPDMAEALRDLLARLGKYIDRRVPDDGPDWEFSNLWKEIEKARAALAKAGL